MYALVDRGREDLLTASKDVEVVTRYPEFLLVRAAALPQGIAAGEAEVLDDETVAVHGERVAIPEGEFTLDGTPHTLVRFAGPVAPEWRAAMDGAGVEVRFWCPRFGACVRLPEGMDGAALRSTLPFVVGARPYTEALCSRGIGEQPAFVRERSGIPGGLYDLVCFSGDERAAVEAELGRMGVEVLASSSSKIRVRYDGDPAVLRDVTGVKLVDPARAPVPLAATLQDALGAAAPTGEWVAGVTGRGQVVAVADSGLDRGVADDQLHGDFRGRVRFIRSWPINPSWAPFVETPGADDGPADDRSGHGTHVAGLAVGNGSMSGGSFRGVAPEAELVFQAIEQFTRVRPQYAAQMPTGTYLSGRPMDLRELFREAREHGARIHVNAWGDPAQGRYTDDAYEADLFLHQNPDAVVLFAAGNGGSDLDGDRVPDARTLYAPATAKNVIAIGATEGGGVGVGMRGRWGDFDAGARRFRAEADRADAVSGEPDRLALSSSAGPTVDGRIKPDLCAPGTNLAAPRSAVCQGQGWGLATPACYMYNGGTSMAVGVAGGFMALLRQSWEERLGAAPSGAALKAAAVLGARPVRGRRTGADEARGGAGFGRVDLAGSAPRQPGRVVRLHDEAAGLATGEAREFPVTLRRGGTLRAVLAWYDAPGEVLVNDLDLALVAPGGERVWGNHAPGERGAPDRVNTVEVIHLPDLPAGAYTLRVSATNVPSGRQPFALVVSSPAPDAIRLPVGSLVGMGSTVAARLARAGVATVTDLARLDDAALAGFGVRGRVLQEVRARLRVLDDVTMRTPAGVPPHTTLDALLDPASAPPAGTDPRAWREAASALTPLLLVFSPGRLARIRVADLFDPAP